MRQSSDEPVGELEITLVGVLHGITYELLPLREVAHRHHYSESYVRQLCDSGQLIATKYLGRWYVEKHLSKLQRYPPVQDTA